MPTKKHNSKKSIPKIKEKAPIPKSGHPIPIQKSGNEMKGKRITSLSTSGKKKRPI